MHIWAVEIFKREGFLCWTVGVLSLCFRANWIKQNTNMKFAIPLQLPSYSLMYKMSQWKLLNNGHIQHVQRHLIYIVVHTCSRARYNLAREKIFLKYFSYSSCISTHLKHFQLFTLGFRNIWNMAHNFL